MTRQVLKDVLALLERQHHKPSPQWLIAADKHGNRRQEPPAVTRRWLRRRHEALRRHCITPPVVAVGTGSNS
jgi:hypothetical protein